MVIMKFLAILTSFFIIFLSPFARANGSCKQLFGSLLQVKDKAQRNWSSDIHPKFNNITEEQKLAQQWAVGKGRTTVKTFRALLPSTVSFITHSLRESTDKTLVKFPTDAHPIILRAKYKSQGRDLETNITLSKYGLLDNLTSNPKYLIGKSSPAAIVFLHGGGTKSSGGHVAVPAINHFAKKGIPILSPDLLWHGEGPRTFMGSLDQEIQALSDLVRQYIHPDVPVFVWGHSWGGSFVHRIMQMSDQTIPGHKVSFHKNLKGLIITSPAVDSAPGQSLQEKNKTAILRKEQIYTEKNKAKISPAEMNFLEKLVRDGKTSPVGAFAASLTLIQLDDQVPIHEGSEYPPAIMIVGKGDSLVYVGFEDLFANYYNKLKNVQTYYLDSLPLLVKPEKEEIVGHLLSDYLPSTGEKVPVNFKLVTDFISQFIDIQDSIQNKTGQNKRYRILDVLQMYSGDLAFREWVNQTQFIEIFHTLAYEQLTNELKENIQDMHTLFNANSFQTSFLNELEVSSKKAREGDLDLDKFRDRMKQYGRPLSNQVVAQFLRNLNEIKKDNFKQTVLELISQTETSLKATLKSPTKKSTVYKNFLKIRGQEEVQDFFDKYFYFSKSEQENIQKQSQKIKQIQDQLSGVYSYMVEDFREIEPELSEDRIQKKIEMITLSAEQLKKLRQKEYDLKKEMGRLKKQLYKNLIKIKSHIKRIKAIFDDVILYPPESLTTEYKKNQEEFSKLFELSKQMEDTLEATVLNALETNSFSDEKLIQTLEQNKDLIDTFTKQYEIFIESRKKSRSKVIEFFLNGKVKRNDSNESFKAIYSETGLYARTQTMTFELAVKEMELLKLVKRIAEEIQFYQGQVPNAPLYSIIYHEPKKYLNIANFNEDKLDKYHKAFELILSQWNFLDSQLMPERPK